MKPRRKGIGITLFFALIVILELAAAIAFSYLLIEILQNGFGITIGLPWLLLLFLVSLLVSSAVTALLNKRFFIPIRQLNDAMHRVAAGDFYTRLLMDTSIREIQDISTNFNLMTKELAATEILQTDFITNVSHEIKTPINAIEGYAMLLQDSRCSDEERGQYVEKILFNTKRLSELVGNILLLSKLDNQAIQTKTAPFRLDEQIRQSIMLLESNWSKKEIEFDVDLEEIEIVGSSSLLQHVWNNLLDNAIKFNPHGGSIVIRLHRQQNRVVFTIRDSGPGIPTDALGHIFDKFYQADSSHRQKGNGLGLALVKRILDLSGGEIAVESLPECGCLFRVTLPLVR